MAPVGDLVGEELDGRYRLLSLLGRGGMGAVYRAERMDTEQPVAIKVLHPGLTDPSARPRFLREARLAARIEHPGVVRILDFGPWGPERDSHYLCDSVFEEVEAGACRAVLLHGAAGVGKSALLRGFGVSLAEAGRCTLLRYQCVDNGGDFTEGLDRFLGTVGRPREDVVEAAREFLRRHDEEDEAEVQGLASLLRPSAAAPADPQAGHALAARVLRRLAQRRPLLLVIDDAALAGGSAVGFVAHALFEAAYEPFPLMLALTWREADATPPFDRGRARSDRFEGVQRWTRRLGPLDRPTLVRGLIEDAGQPRARAQAVAARSGGNPLYARLLLAAKDDGALPDRLQALIEADQRSRLGRARAPDRARRLLEGVAVLGRRVDFGLLRRFLEADPAFDDLEDDLDDLVELGLLDESPQGDPPALLFPHGLARDVVLETTLPRRERRLHRHAAAILRRGPSGPGTAAAVAQHLSLAGDELNLHDAWTRAAEAERALGHVGRAAEHAQAAIDALPGGDGRQPAAQLLLGEVLADSGDAAPARRALEPLLDGPLAPSAAEALGHVLEAASEGIAQARLISRIEAAGRTASPRQQRALLRVQAAWLNASGRHLAAIEVATAALDGAEAGSEATRAAEQLAFAQRLAGHPAAAAATAERAQENARDDDDRARARRAMGLVHLWRGEGTLARQELEEAAELLRRSGRMLRLSRVTLDLASVELVDRRYEPARRELMEAARTARAAGDRWSEQTAGLRGLYAALLDGRSAGARGIGEALIARSAGRGVRFFSEVEAPLLAWIDITEGRMSEAFERLGSIPRLDAWAAVPDAAWVLEGIGRALDGRGSTRAVGFFTLAAGYWRRCGNNLAAQDAAARAREAR